MRNVEAGLGRGEGGSERIREAWGREGGVKVELKPRAGRTEGLGGIRGFLAFPGRIRTRGGLFWVLSKHEKLRAKVNARVAQIDTLLATFVRSPTRSKLLLHRLN